ncbi:MAG: type II secretion system F family protein [Balneolaceae bacterium]
MSKYPPAIAAQKKRHKQNKPAFKKGLLWERISEKTVIDFTRSMAVMIKARIPLVKVLDTSIGQTENKRFRQILEDVRKKVKSGNGLAKSLSSHTGVFNELYIHLIDIGEMAGILDEILFRLAGYMEKRHSLKQKVRMAMVYPSMVMAVAAGATLFLLLFIVPTFAEMYNDFDAELPGPTQFVLSVSNFFTNNFLYIVFLIMGSIIGIRAWTNSTGGRYFIDRLKLDIPLIGSFYQKTIMTRFCQTLGTLLASGITLVDALNIIRKASGNVLVSEATEEMLRSVKKGGSLTKSLERSRVFPGMVIQMVTVGEETAELDEMLLHIASLYDEEVDTAVEGLTSIIEPVLIVVLGVLLGGIIISMYLPIFELMNVIQ